VKARSGGLSEKQPAEFCDLDRILEHPCLSRVGRFAILDPNITPIAKSVNEEITSRFGDFLDACDDLQTHRGLVRKGRLKLVPFGPETLMVAKRTSETKPGKLRRDIENAIAFRGLLEKTGQNKTSWA
jgi:hypothetical protein